MEDRPLDVNSRHFPPRTGASFFLLWTAGICVLGLLLHIVHLTSPDLSVRQSLAIVCIVVGAAWNAYLIFPFWDRRVIWTLLPWLTWTAVGGIATSAFLP